MNHSDVFSHKQEVSVTDLKRIPEKVKEKGWIEEL